MPTRTIKLPFRNLNSNLDGAGARLYCLALSLFARKGKAASLLADRRNTISLKLYPSVPLASKASTPCPRVHFQRGVFYGGGATFHCLLYFLEGAFLNLSHAFARDAKFGSEVLEPDRVIGQPTRFEDAPLAIVENVERRDQCLVAIVALLAFRQDAFLARRIVDKPILPFATFAIVANRRVERGVAAETAVHVDDVLFRHAKAVGNDLQ